MKISKTVSLPLSFVERVLEEQFLTGQDFSATLVVLAQIGIAVRRDARKREEEEEKRIIENREKQLLNAKVVD